MLTILLYLAYRERQHLKNGSGCYIFEFSIKGNKYWSDLSLDLTPCFPARHVMSHCSPYSLCLTIMINRLDSTRMRRGAGYGRLINHCADGYNIVVP
jgi:hypothetical protein